MMRNLPPLLRLQFINLVSVAIQGDVQVGVSVSNTQSECMCLLAI